MATTTTNKPRNQTEELKERASDVAERAKDTARDVGEKAKETAGKVADQVRSTAETAKEKADQAAASAGKGIESFAGQMRQQGPQEGMLGRANTAVADTLEQSGRYLEEKGLSGMAEDVTDVIRRNPIPSVMVGVALGFLLARMTSRS